MALQEIEYGSIASSQILNDNFDYLDDQISDLATSIGTVQSNMASINSNLSSQIASVSTSILGTIYPIGSIYIGTTENCPLAGVIGTWTKVSEGRVLQGSDESHLANTTIEAGLPDHNHVIPITKTSTGHDPSDTYPLRWNDGDYAWRDVTAPTTENASGSNSIYGNSDTVQPPAYVVNIWRRTA